MPIERVELRYTCYNAFMTLKKFFKKNNQSDHSFVQKTVYLGSSQHLQRFEKTMPLAGWLHGISTKVVESIYNMH